MPEAAAEMISEWHDFKTSPMAGFEELYEMRKTVLCRLFCPFLQPGIQMDADTDDHGEEGIPLPGMDSHIMQMVVVQNTVVYSFAGSAVIVNFLIFIRTSGYRSIESDVPFRFCVDTAAVRRGRTFFPAGAGSCFAAGKWAAPFAGMLLSAVAPVDHTEPGHAQGCAVIINGDGIRNGIRPAPVGVQVDKRADVPFPAEPVSGIVVMG